jgi:predicted nucleic acid-binding protein
MTNSAIIADSGFWIALFNRSDRFHAASVAALTGLERRLITTWPVMTETCHILLRRGGHAIQQQFLSQWVQGRFDIFGLTQAHAPKIQSLMHKYVDLPMDLADASLVLLAGELGHGDILTTDQRDFGAYRWKSRRPFTNLLLVE